MLGFVLSLALACLSSAICGDATTKQTKLNLQRHNSSGSVISVAVSVGNEVINVTSKRYVSFTIDASQVTDGRYNFSNTQMRYLMKQLSPAVLRVGGTQADYTYYEVGDENPCKLPSSDYHCLSMSRLSEMVDMAKDVGAYLIYGLSIGYPEYPDMSTSAWNGSNTRQMLQYLHDSKKYTTEDIYGFELGNEVNKDVLPSFQSRALYSLQSILEDVYAWNASSSSFQLWGPDPHSYTLRENAHDFDWIIEFIESTCDILHAITYHSYVNQNQSQIFTLNGLSLSLFLSQCNARILYILYILYIYRHQ